MRPLRSLASAAAGLTLTGCATVSGWFADEPAEPPTPLAEITPSLEVRTVWSTDVGGGHSGRTLALVPQVGGDRVFAATARGRVVALDASSGSTEWRTEVDAPLSAGPGVGGGVVVVGSVDGDVFALQADTGSVRWRTRVSSEVLAPPAVGRGVVVVRTVDGRLHGLDVKSGNRLWLYENPVPLLTLRGTGAPTLTRELAIAGFDGGRLVALLAQDGRPVWEGRLAAPRGRSDLERMVDIDSAPVVAGDTVYAVALHGMVAALEVTTGKPRWQREMSSHAGLAVDDRLVYVTDDKGHVWALDRFSGRALWRQEKLAHRGVTAPAALGPYVVVGDFEGYLHWLRREDGELAARQRVDKSGFDAAPLAARGVLYAYGRGGTLAALRPGG